MLHRRQRRGVRAGAGAWRRRPSSTSPTLVGVGGGAGGLARYVARRLGWPLEIPAHAEVISSIGDALSLIRAERERTVTNADSADARGDDGRRRGGGRRRRGAARRASRCASRRSPSAARCVRSQSALSGLTAGATPGRDRDRRRRASRPRRQRHRRQAGGPLLAAATRRRDRGPRPLRRRGDPPARRRRPRGRTGGGDRAPHPLPGPDHAPAHDVDHRRSAAARARRRTGVDQPVRRTARTSPTSSEGSADGALHLGRQAVPPHARDRRRRRRSSPSRSAG